MIGWWNAGQGVLAGRSGHPAPAGLPSRRSRSGQVEPATRPTRNVDCGYAPAGGEVGERRRVGHLRRGAPGDPSCQVHPRGPGTGRGDRHAGQADRRSANGRREAMKNREQTRAALLAALDELGRVRPDWRLGQTLANLAMTAGRLEAGGVWDLEDEEALAAARELIAQAAAESCSA